MSHNNWRELLPELPLDSDGDAMRGVIANGADLSRPMTIDFCIAIPNRKVGEMIAPAAMRLGYKVAVDQDADSGRWTCYCTRTMILTYGAVIDAQRELDQIGVPYGGYSDGWGTFGNRECEK